MISAREMRETSLHPMASSGGAAANPVVSRTSRRRGCMGYRHRLPLTARQLDSGWVWAPR